MGNQESKGTEFINSFSKNYKYEREINDQRLGEVKIYQKIQDEKDYVAVKVYPRMQKVNQLNTFTAFMMQNGNYIGTNQNEHPNLVKLHAFQANKDEELTLYYEYCYTNIKEQTDMRVQHGYHYSPEELWRTSLSVIMAGYFLESQNRHIGDINTKRIFINKKGVIKVAPYMQAQSDIDSFKRAGFFNQNGYLSPECLEKLKKRDILSSIDFNKNDVFGLGISILEMTTLKNSIELYDWVNFEIKQDILDERLNESKQRYGTYLEIFLQKLLDRDVNKRSTFSQLYQELLPYQQQIITGVGFKELSIFKGNNIQFDSEIKDIKSSNLHSKQESQASSQANQFGKYSNFSSSYLNDEKNKPISFQQQYSTAQPASVQINLSPPKAQPQSIPQQQSQEVKTEESENSFINKGQATFDMSYYSNNNYSQFAVNPNYVSSNKNSSNINPQLLNQDGYNNSARDNNILIHRECNVNKPQNPDHRSLSPSPVIHMQTANQSKPSFHQKSPIQLIEEYESQTKQPLQEQQGQPEQQLPLTEKVGFNYNNYINLQDHKKSSIPIKKITLNNIVNPKVNMKNVVSQQNPLNNKIFVKNNIPQYTNNSFSQENVFTGNIIQNQPVEKSYITTQVKSPLIQMSIPVSRTNRNMIINPIQHHNRSVSPQHFMVQRSITPTVRTPFANQIMLVQPKVVNNVVQPVRQSVNGSILHENKQKNGHQFSFHETNSNKLIAEGTISPRYTVQNNSFHYQPAGNIQGYAHSERQYVHNQLGVQKQHIILQKQGTLY